MTDMDNDHANQTNPCQGICAVDEEGYCVGCFRTSDERSNWYLESAEWREKVLEEVKKREEKYFS